MARWSRLACPTIRCRRCSRCRCCRDGDRADPSNYRATILQIAARLLCPTGLLRTTGLLLWALGSASGESLAPIGAGASRFATGIAGCRHHRSGRRRSVEWSNCGQQLAPVADQGHPDADRSSAVRSPYRRQMARSVCGVERLPALRRELIHFGEWVALGSACSLWACGCGIATFRHAARTDRRGSVGAPCRTEPSDRERPLSAVAAHSGSARNSSKASTWPA
jgi:hypothetical protein